MSPPSFNPHSTDAMFATILAEMQTLTGKVEKTLDLCERNDARVLILEQSAIASKGRIAGAIGAMSLVVGVLGWVVKEGLHKLFSST